MTSFECLGSGPADTLEILLERLYALYPKAVDLSLDRLRRLLDALGNPQLALPPVIHVAGTNGKGSTCAFLRAIAEKAGLPTHLYTSPHLVTFNERYRVAGRLASDETLLASFRHIETVNAGQQITAFEAITAAAFDLFSKNPAALCVVEVGLGGRFDATNVMPHPACCAIASISQDHAEFLGTDLGGIAREKAGIIKKNCPVVTGHQDPLVLAVLRDEARQVGAPFLARDEAWSIVRTATGVTYRDNQGTLDLPSPSLAGDHQIDNAGIAIAALRHAVLGHTALGHTTHGHTTHGQTGLAISNAAFSGIDQAEWPARMQRLRGQLASRVPACELWLDGGHNPGAATMLAAYIEQWRDRPLYLVVGMKQAKDLQNFLSPFFNGPLGQADALFAVAEPGQFQAVPVPDIIAASGGQARSGPDISGALTQIAALPPGRVLICGSLYLAGEALKYDGKYDGRAQD